MKRDKASTIKAIEKYKTVPKAAQMLGITSTRLYKWLKDNNLEVVVDSEVKVVGHDQT